MIEFNFIIFLMAFRSETSFGCNDKSVPWVNSQCYWTRILEYHYEWRMALTHSAKVSIFSEEIFSVSNQNIFPPQSWPRGQRRESWWAWVSDWGLVGLGPLWVRSPFHPSAHGWLSLTGMTISPPNHQPVRYTQSNALQSYNGEEYLPTDFIKILQWWKIDVFLPSVPQKSSPSSHFWETKSTFICIQSPAWVLNVAT